MKSIKISTLSSLSFATIFGLVSLVFYFGEWERLFIVTALGLFIGLLAAPEFDKKAFKNPTLFQTVSGAIGGAIACSLFATDMEALILSSFVGGFIGWSASFWVKHVPIP